MRINGHPEDVLASYANDPIVSPEHERYAMNAHGGRHLDGSPVSAYPRTGEGTNATLSTLNSPQRTWFLPYDAKVDLGSTSKRPVLKSGKTSKGIREDGRRDRRAAKKMARKHDQEAAVLLKTRHDAAKARRELERQYNRGPGHTLITKHRHSPAGKLLRKQLEEGNSTHFERLSKFEHPSGTTTDRVLENVHFVARLLVVNPTTGSPTRARLDRTPTAEPGSRLTLRIEARNLGFANPSRPMEQQDVGAILTVQRGTLVDFEVHPAKTSGLRVIPTLTSTSFTRGPRGSGIRSSSRSSGGGSGAELCRMLWRGNRCVVDVPLLCGKGAVTGPSTVMLNILAGQRIAGLRFRLEITRGSYQRVKRRPPKEEVALIPWAK
jgi:hypothetical protein